MSKPSIVFTTALVSLLTAVACYCSVTYSNPNVGIVGCVLGFFAVVGIAIIVE